MALTVTIANQAVKGNRYHRTGTIAFDAAYAAGGEAYTPNQFGLSKVDQLRLQQVGLVGGAPHFVIHNKATAKLQVYVGTTGAEAGAIDLSAFSIDFEVEGLL